ncbi:MAG TPA: flagella basal body P-ring formation protein FlgA [Acidobacteriaceae bacterium]|nr:flagella basal body P-ring formation protein FlgA [Acidobacteriaceae bacterium]
MPALREGYVVQSVKTDPVLKSQWVMVANCGHPERPRIAVEIPSRRAKTDLAPRATSGQASLPPKISRIPITIPTASAANQNFIQRSPATPQAPSSASVSRPNPPSVSTPVTPVLVRAGDRVVLWSQEPQLRLEIEAVALEYGRAGQVIHLRRNRETALLSGVVRGPGSVELMP